jgi:NADPH:quinone reductase
MRAGADAINKDRSEDAGGPVKTLACGRCVDAVIEVARSGNTKLYPDILHLPHNGRRLRMSAGETTLPALWVMQNSITLRPSCPRHKRGRTRGLHRRTQPRTDRGTPRSS